MDEPSMLENFSLLIPSKNFKSWKGHIPINMHFTYIEIYCPNSPKLKDLKVHIPEYEVFNNHHNCLKDLTETSKIWKQDTSLMFQNLSYKKVDDIFYVVMNEINIYDQYVHEIDENMKHITFNVLDVYRHDHFIKIYLPDEYPVVNKQPLLFETMIPSISMKSLSKINSVLKLFEEFKCVIIEFNNFWKVYYNIINTCHVIGSYSFKDVNFKIPIDNFVCVEVEVDPFNPCICPKFILHGQPKSVESFQLRLNEINPILTWNTEINFKDNILNVFGISSLQSQYEENNTKHNDEPSNDSNYCFICYDNLDTIVKKQTKTCVNEECDALYHMACICEWLLNSGSTPMFEHLQGKCPQCEEDMLVALENFDLIKS